MLGEGLAIVREYISESCDPQLLAKVQISSVDLRQPEITQLYIFQSAEQKLSELDVCLQIVGMFSQMLLISAFHVEFHKRSCLLHIATSIAIPALFAIVDTVSVNEAILVFATFDIMSVKQTAEGSSINYLFMGFVNQKIQKIVFHFEVFYSPLGEVFLPVEKQAIEDGYEDWVGYDCVEKDRIYVSENVELYLQKD